MPYIGLAVGLANGVLAREADEPVQRVAPEPDHHAGLGGREELGHGAVPRGKEEVGNQKIQKCTRASQCTPRIVAIPAPRSGHVHSGGDWVEVI